MQTNNPFPQEICEQIWDRKYKLITPNAEIPNDQSVEDTWQRIANAMARSFPIQPRTSDEQESLYKQRQERFYNALEDFKFLPAGRITAGAGSGREVTLFNCYVMGQIPDSMGGIFDMLKEAALTMQQGGGIGYDFSPLRPTGAPVKGVDADASGPTTFMDVWDAMCRTIMSAGARRGAMMATMACDHPDVEDFITAKHDSTRLRMFNVSVLATDEFMQRVKADEEWPLMHKVPPVEPVKWNNVTEIDGKHIYKVIRARDLWNLMMESTYNHAEPGVLFVDQINKMNNLWYVEHITATNPCGEQPLPPYGACLLGSVNLVKMVTNPFASDAAIDFELLKQTTKDAVAMLDSIIDTSLFPIPQQEEEAKAKRRMGIGITGLGDLLFMLDHDYGSDEAVGITKTIMKTMAIAAYEESIKMAQQYGPCPVTETKEQRIKFCQSGYMKQMPKHIIEGVMRHGIRNALLLSIAPTGTISMYAGNVSSGIEPIFAPTFTRKVLNDDGKTSVEQEVHDYAVQIYHEMREIKGYDKDPEVKELLTAQDLSPTAHLRMQAAAQQWVDSSISKTINLPEDISFEEFEQVYLEAYEMGCKGCTTYRPNETTGSVISVKPKKSEPVEQAHPATNEPDKESFAYAPRREILDGKTYKLKWENKNYYVTINNSINDQGQIVPFEIFINTQDMSQFQYIVALTRMMSSVFRRNTDIRFVIEDLKSIMDPNGGAWVNGSYVHSFIALLGKTIEEHLKGLSFVDELTEVIEQNVDEFKFNEDDIPVVKPTQCTECLGYNTQLSSGCPTCLDCGYSRCG